MTTQPHSLTHAAVNAALTELADACWLNERALMPAAFIDMCEKYGVELEAATCDCGQPPGWACTCDALVDERAEMFWEVGDDA